jgi:hypothetical protein
LRYGDLISGQKTGGEELIGGWIFTNGTEAIEVADLYDHQASAAFEREGR